MPILTENVKLMASQRLTDNDDGGGRMSGVEIVDGNVNNLFPDISRLDRTIGRVSLRKAFVSVQTADTDAYSGAHVILSLPASDPNVSVCLFSTSDPHDERTEARDRVESYVTLGPRFPGWLWGDQSAGSRSLFLFCVKGTPLPDIGSVLCLFKDKGTANEIQQYCRITKVESTSGDFTSLTDGEYGQAALEFKRDIFKLEIGDPLRATFPGIEITQNDSLATNVYQTTVSDAAQYYGVMLPTAPIGAGDIEINVDSIFTHLVPSAQGESPMVDLTVGEAGPVCGVGSGYTLSIPSVAVAGNAQLHFGRGIMPKTLALVGGGHTYADDGNGILTEGSSQVGTVDYSVGTVNFVNIPLPYTASFSMSATIGAEAPRVPNTQFTYVELANRGYNYTSILNPLPVPGSIWVDYMAQGKWYRLRDNRSGVMVPDITGTGTGTVNYATGNIIITCAALPDVETSIIYSWSNPVELVDITGDVEIDVAEVTHKLAHFPVKPGSFVMSWPIGVASEAIAIDDGSGIIKMSGEGGTSFGWINYATGEMIFRPTVLPITGGEYTIDYDKYPVVMGTAAMTGTGSRTLQLPSSPIKPGTVSMGITVHFSEYPHVYPVSDNGSGVLSAPGWNINASVTHPDWPGTTSVSGITGVIDYVTGICVIDLGDITGIETWKEPEVTETCSDGTATTTTPPTTDPSDPSVPSIADTFPQVGLEKIPSAFGWSYLWPQ